MGSVVTNRFLYNRRDFVTLLGGAAAAWPRVARGQFKPAIIGVLGSGSAQSSAFLIGALKEGMNENGLAEGRDYVLDVRWAEGDYTREGAKPAGIPVEQPTLIELSINMHTAKALGIVIPDALLAR